MGACEKANDINLEYINVTINEVYDRENPNYTGAKTWAVEYQKK